MGELLCRRCDVFVGYGAVGVIRKPAGEDSEWLRNHCWVCGRSRKQIEEETVK